MTTTTPPHGLSRRDFLKMAGTTGAAALTLGALTNLSQTAEACRVSQAVPADLPTIQRATTTLPVKDFSMVAGRNSTLSASQINQHIGLYQGYVNKLNAANTALTTANQTHNYSSIRTLQLNRSYAYDGAILHDLYFSNLGEDQPTIGELTHQLLERDFGSMDQYYADVLAVGTKMRGWVITGYSQLDNRVYNFGLDAHDAGMPTRVCPLMVMDVYEHAYMIDFGTKRADYLNAFKHAIRWDEVEDRTRQALTFAAFHADHASNHANKLG